jgi:hypothetical protein
MKVRIGEQILWFSAAHPENAITPPKIMFRQGLADSRADAGDKDLRRGMSHCGASILLFALVKRTPFGIAVM